MVHRLTFLHFPHQQLHTHENVVHKHRLQQSGKEKGKMRDLQAAAATGATVV